ncbi:MAG: methyltransferase domain-containing protein [Oscillospiraceae bacterium]|nr:methyltransferase domain-containing protein [Oscillospiraceae bacterium]
MKDGKLSRKDDNMFEWNSDQYLKFKAQRTQPAIDLAKRVADVNPKTVLDIGCGPGNSTAVLKSIFPNAQITGIDTSQDMIDKAKKTYPDIDFRPGDARDISEKYDLLFSNACLQWIPNHKELIPYLMSRLNDGGKLAVQIPMNGEEPLFRIIRDVVSEMSLSNLERQWTLKPDEYYEILSGCSDNFKIWETVYYHDLPNHDALLEWVKGTHIRPYLAQFSEADGIEFENEILKRTKKIYPVMSDGKVILRFRRFFFTAAK